MPATMTPAVVVEVPDITVGLAVVAEAVTLTRQVRAAEVAGRRTHPALGFQEPTTQPMVLVPQRLVLQFHI